MEALVEGCAIVLRTYLPHRNETLKYIRNHEPFAVMLDGVLYRSMADAAKATGATEKRIHMIVGRINAG